MGPPQGARRLNRRPRSGPPVFWWIPPPGRVRLNSVHDPAVVVGRHGSVTQKKHKKYGKTQNRLNKKKSRLSIAGCSYLVWLRPLLKTAMQNKKLYRVAPKNHFLKFRIHRISWARWSRRRNPCRSLTYLPGCLEIDIYTFTTTLQSVAQTH